MCAEHHEKKQVEKDTFLSGHGSPSPARIPARFTRNADLRPEPYKVGKRIHRNSPRSATTITATQVKEEFNEAYSVTESNDSVGHDGSSALGDGDSQPETRDSDDLDVKVNAVTKTLNEGKPSSVSDTSSMYPDSGASVKYEPDEDDEDDIEITSVEAGTPVASLQDSWSSNVSMGTSQDMAVPQADLDQSSKFSFHFLFVQLYFLQTA